MADQLGFHPIADCFPLLEGEAFDALCRSVADSFRTELGRIVTFEGAILDGRNRYRALRQAKIEPDQFLVAFDGDFEQAKDFVVAGNLNRRHLTKKQLAVAASKLANCTSGGQVRGHGLPSHEDLEEAEKTSLSQAAEKLRVSRRMVVSVREYEKLKAAGALKPQEIDAVENQDVPHSSVVEKARARARTKKARETRGPSARDKMQEAAARRRFLMAVGQMESAVEALAAMKTAALTKKETNYARNVFNKTTSLIRKLRKEF